ncbi:hypothetical protein ACVIGB_000556 [Bradyrhizobium sp. USDA 4341]
MTTDLTERDLQVLKAMARSHGGISLDTIAARMGYQPARSGRVAVAGTLRSMLKRHGSQDGLYGTDSKYIIRLPPRDQWDCSKWALTNEGRAVIAAAEQTVEPDPPAGPGPR